MQAEVRVADLLRCPKTGAGMRLKDGAYRSEADPEVRFPIEQGLLRAYLPHDAESSDVTRDIRAFYEENPFPNYDDVDDIGSLIEKSLARGFPELLNRSIPLNARVLEVGCGTGQLGNFLSISSRPVLSCDLCLNSLLLAQRFKERNGLRTVTFAQMNLFRLPLQPASFDVVICTGVLHHTADPREGLRRLVPLVRPGGHLIVGLYNRYGRLKTRFRRALFARFGDRFASMDPYIRKYELDPQKRRAWYMDQYHNPHESLHTIDQVLGWFEQEGVRFVRSFPSAIFGGAFELDYNRSIFEEEPRGSWMDRLLGQLHQMLTDDEGGLFVMVGRRE